MNLQSPTSYADWVKCFQMLIEGGNDAELLEVMAKGKVPWTKGVAERFVQRMTEAISHRLQLALNDFLKQLGRARGEENAIVQTILALRRSSQYLLQLVKLPVFPEEIRTNFIEEIEKNLKQVHDIMLDEVKKDPSGRLIRVVQHTPFLIKEQPITEEQPKTKEVSRSTGKPKRGIIF